MNYKKIDFSTWPRRELFKHFIDDVRCVVTITADIDISKVLDFCQESNRKFYPAMLFLVSKTINKHDEFKLGYNSKGDIILWDRVCPSHVVFNKNDEIFTRLITEYDDSFTLFHDRVIGDIKNNTDKRAFQIKYEQTNTFDVSCLPWLHYKSCDLHVYDKGTYLAPVITWGKYVKSCNNWFMPLTMQIHHAVADGFHIARFFTELENEIQNFDA